MIDGNGYFVSQRFFQILPPVVMSTGPCTGFRRVGIDKGDLHMVRMGEAEKTGQNALRSVFRFGDDLKSGLCFSR